MRGGWRAARREGRRRRNSDRIDRIVYREWLSMNGGDKAEGTARAETRKRKKGDSHEGAKPRRRHEGEGRQDLEETIDREEWEKREALKIRLDRLKTRYAALKKRTVRRRD
ncbi:MAG: hypothetical protein V2A58_13080, partial [Planctomycetota bacterium]